ncbi:peptide chain release factor H [Labrys wisconsinensis]|uniref:Peptide chain release factor n=1 Tax=Labrys wisconsinensis TaxID=425677 RepID=A0ABU0J7N0_9HYPH|nr:peptide chain release factor H [Labrys wisconsinensis]MDQ0470273.1 peptide chain release factor [Labrys wisconsinensis]
MAEADLVLMVTAGRGPAECRVVVARVARRLAEEAAAAGLSVALDLGEADEAAASVLVALGGEGAPAFAAGWTGTVLWVDEALRGGRARRNWYVGVHRLAKPARTAPLSDADVRYEAMRAGGPGGQHQNVTESAVRAVHVPTGLSAIAREGRSQHQNRKQALARLSALLSAVADRAAAGAKRSEWLDRIEVERGNPRRTFRSA